MNNKAREQQQPDPVRENAQEAQVGMDRGQIKSIPVDTDIEARAKPEKRIKVAQNEGEIPAQTAQEMPEYTDEQKAALLAEAAKITGKPAEDFTIEQAVTVIFNDTVTKAQVTLNEVMSVIQSDAYTTIKKTVRTLSDLIEQYISDIAAQVSATKEIQDLAPFLEIELKKQRKDPAFADATLDDLLEQGFDASGNPTESQFKQIIERARKLQAEYKEAKDTVETIEQAAEELPRIIAHPTDLLTYPLDKPNSIIWNLLATADPNGQLSLDIDTGKKGSKQEALVYYSISFDELESSVKIIKQLTPFDKRVYIAAAALFNSGNETISATQIHKTMGNSGLPSAEQLQKINDSLTKMGAAHIYLDNVQEVQVNKKCPRFKYDAALLPFERLSAYVNGQFVESAIHLFREPPLITFARQRGQFTSLKRELLESPISKTDANLQLEDYLLERIGRMKNPKSKTPRKMLFSTICDKCGITTKKQKQRAPEKIRRYLDHYKKCGWITGYTESADGITIQV